MPQRSIGAERHPSGMRLGHLALTAVPAIKGMPPLEETFADQAPSVDPAEVRHMMNRFF